MEQIIRLLATKNGYVAARANVASSRPGGRLAVLTCMDARIEVSTAPGLHLGEAHVIRNAGGRVTEVVLRGLALSTHVLGVDTVVMMQLTKGGLVGVTDDQLHSLTGADLGLPARRRSRRCAPRGHRPTHRDPVPLAAERRRRVRVRPRERRDRRGAALGAAER